MCKLRISAHKLNIGVGRYNKTPRNERFCKKCNTDEIEADKGIILKVQTYKERIIII
jgi:hypothetical protein